MQQSSDPGRQFIDLRAFLGVLRSRRWTVLLVTVLVVCLATFLVARRAPVFTATARVEVRPLTSSLSYPGAFDELQSSMDTEAERVTSEPVVELAAEGVGTRAATAADVTTSVPANTTFIDISCTEPSAAAAQGCANSFALAYIKDRRQSGQEEYASIAEPLQEQVRRATRRLETLNQQLAGAADSRRDTVLGKITSTGNDRDTAQLQLLAIPTPSASPARLSLPAELPAQPSNKGFVITGSLALIVGLAMGLGLAVLRERLDERVGDREGLEQALDAPALALVPHVPGWRNRDTARVITITAPDSAASEAYRAARTMLLYLATEGDQKVIAITGPGQAEGKTTTTVNLAVSLAQSGKRVIAVSADLRKPRLHRFFHLDNSVGVSSVLAGTTDLVPALARTEVGNLLLLSSGPVPSNPAELLASPEMDDLLDELRPLCDIVLVDTPPTLVVADILGLAPKVDGMVVVADAASTQRSAVAQLRQQLERAGGQILGGILNNVDTSASYGGYRDYGYGDDQREEPPQSAGNGVAANGSDRTPRPAGDREPHPAR